MTVESKTLSTLKRMPKTAAERILSAGIKLSTCLALGVASMALAPTAEANFGAKPLPDDFPLEISSVVYDPSTGVTTKDSTGKHHCLLTTYAAGVGAIEDDAKLVEKLILMGHLDKTAKLNVQLHATLVPPADKSQREPTEIEIRFAYSLQQGDKVIALTQTRAARVSAGDFTLFGGRKIDCHGVESLDLPKVSQVVVTSALAAVQINQTMKLVNDLDTTSMTQTSRALDPIVIRLGLPKVQKMLHREKH